MIRRGGAIKSINGQITLVAASERRREYTRRKNMKLDLTIHFKSLILPSVASSSLHQQTRYVFAATNLTAPPPLIADSRNTGNYV